MWSKKYCDSTSEKLGDIFGEYIEYINFHMIPANVLMKDIRPLDIVPVHIIMNALAYQVKYTIAFIYWYLICIISIALEAMQFLPPTQQLQF